VDESRDLDAQLDAVASVVGAKPDELRPLVEVLPNDGKLSLANLSLLHRWVQLARALQLPVEDLLNWQEWTGVDVFGSAANTVRFVAEAQRQRTVSVPQETLEELLGSPGERDLSQLGQPSAGEALLALSDEYRGPALPLGEEEPGRAERERAVVRRVAALTNLDATLADELLASMTYQGRPLRDALVGAVRAVAAAREADPVGEASPEELIAHFSPAVWETVAIGAWLSRAFDLVAQDLSWLVGRAAHVRSTYIPDVVSWSPIVGATITSGVSDPVGGTAAVEMSDPSDTDAARVNSDTGDYAGGPLMARVWVRKDEAAPQFVEIRIRYSSSTARLFLNLATGATHAVGGGFRSISVVEQVPGWWVVSLVEQGDPAADTVLLQIHPALGFATSFPTPDVAATGSVTIYAPTLRALYEWERLAFGVTAQERYSAWASFREAARLQTISSDGRFFDILAGLLDGTIADAATLRSELAERTGWSEDNLLAAIDDGFSGPLGGSSPGDWAAPERMGRLAAWMTLARTLGVAAGDLGEWGALAWVDDGQFDDPVDVYRRHARQIEQSLRAVWGDERWFVDMPAVRNELRERQRDALVSKITGGGGSVWSSADELGSALLMDLQMGACAKTSRLVDATRAVQLFVQRILTGQESPLQLSEDEAEEWVWRKSYRVWEANRMVFLYPENWLLPELRRFKTPFFAELESELAQSDLEESRVEAAYRGYLRRLAEVSKLEVISMLRVGGDVIHVFARTHGVPQKYFHRQWVDGNRWTPWQPIEVAKVEGQHLLPAFYQRRVLLFWLLISETGGPTGEIAVPTTEGNVKIPYKHFQVRLAWSEFRDGEWAPPTQSESFIGVDTRGEVSPSGAAVDSLLNRLIATIPGEATTFPRTVIHGHVENDQNGRDLLIKLYRDGPESGTIKVLPQFRVSGVDGSITAEPATGGGQHAAEPYEMEGHPYGGHAQRFVEVGARELIVPLWYPASSRDHVGQRLVAAKPAFDPKSLMVTPLDRVTFDTRDPFVFEDPVGSYWVTFHSELPYIDPDLMGFDPMFWNNDDLRFPPPIADRHVSDRIEITPADDSTQFTAIGGLVDHGTLGQLLGSGRKYTAFHSEALPQEAARTAVRSTVKVHDEDTQVVLFEAVSGTADENVDSVVDLALDVFVPPYWINLTRTTEGVHVLRHDVATFRFRTFFHPHVAAMSRSTPTGCSGCSPLPATDRSRVRTRRRR